MADMPTVTWNEVRIYMRHLRCPCGGEMLFQKTSIQDALLPYPHKCQSCGRIQCTSETYPNKFFEEIVGDEATP